MAIDTEFQSPSLRGSGRFAQPAADHGVGRLRFNPLHCGAVVASRRTRRSGRGGSRVSIPFIAGQWSLRVSVRFALHSSSAVSIPFIAGQWSLPQKGETHPMDNTDVSIPFIAGQWSLPEPDGEACHHPPRVSIPFIAGQWSLRARREARRGDPRVSIPFIAGQWSLPVDAGAPRRREARFNPLHCGAVVASNRRRMAGVGGGGRFQSPSLRGSGRFERDVKLAAAILAFQSPSLRGSGRFRGRNGTEV